MVHGAPSEIFSGNIRYGNHPICGMANHTPHLNLSFSSSRSMDILRFLLIGLVAGWLVGRIMRSGWYGISGNMVIGVIGSVIGGFLFQLVGPIQYGMSGSVLMATIGAIVFIAASRALERLSDPYPSADH